MKIMFEHVIFISVWSSLFGRRSRILSGVHADPSHRSNQIIALPSLCLSGSPRLGQRSIESGERLGRSSPDGQSRRERGTLLTPAEAKPAPQKIDRGLPRDVLVPVAGIGPGREKSYY